MSTLVFISFMYIKQATKTDKTPQKLKYLILENRWFEIQKEFMK